MHAARASEAASTGATAYDRDGDKIGKIGEVYYDDDTDQPKWITVNTGLFGTNESFVPRAGRRSSTATGSPSPTTRRRSRTLRTSPRTATCRRRRSSSSTATTASTTAPGRATTDRPGDRAPRRRHATADATRDGDRPRRTDRDDRAATSAEGRAVGRDTSGPTTDDAMTRSEEQLRVGTETREAGRARLRKHVVTEHQQVTVPVSHEEVTLEREPITDANRGAAYDGPAISEEEHEVTLHAERPVVDTEAVAVERVRLGTRDRHRAGDRRRRGPQGADRARPRRPSGDRPPLSG